MPGVYTIKTDVNKSVPSYLRVLQLGKSYMHTNERGQELATKCKLRKKNKRKPRTHKQKQQRFLVRRHKKLTCFNPMEEY